MNKFLNCAPLLGEMKTGEKQSGVVFKSLTIYHFILFFQCYPSLDLWLVASIVLTMLLHMLILYLEPPSILFSVTPLTWAEWAVVLYLSFPVIIIDEILKFFSRNSANIGYEVFQAKPTAELSPSMDTTGEKPSWDKRFRI